jgi:hypothetical protein
VVVTHPLSSRVHAIVWHDDEGWWVRDAGSRNGTFVNGQRIDHARLVNACTLRVGQDEFGFHHGDPPSAVLDNVNPAAMQTIVMDEPVAQFDTGRFILSALLDDARFVSIGDFAAGMQRSTGRHPVNVGGSQGQTPLDRRRFPVGDGRRRVKAATGPARNRHEKRPVESHIDRTGDEA